MINTKSISNINCFIILTLFILIFGFNENLSQNAKSKEFFTNQNTQEKRYIFYLHHKFIELFGIDSAHFEYGNSDYNHIIDRFKSSGFEVISEIRPKDTDAIKYAKKVSKQIDSLISLGIKPSNITVIGASKGGYIAQFVSSFVNNPSINYVFIGCCNEEDLVNQPNINFSGNVLSIYEKSDVLGQSCQKMKNRTKENIRKFKELELNTGLKHGFLYKNLDNWTIPAMNWAKYQLIDSIKTYKDGKLISNYQYLDSVLESNVDVKNEYPFNGVVIINQNGSTVYSKIVGYSNLEAKTTLKQNDEFVIGSISKQITATIVLREYDKRKLELNVPISIYLPYLMQKWADTVTVHHLLTHTHGIVHLDSALNFPAGSNYEYSQLGYVLLSEIAEKVSGKSFADLSKELFEFCGMINSYHPKSRENITNVNGYVFEKNGEIDKEDKNISNIRHEKVNFNFKSIAAGGFISTANDLLIWNNNLHNGKLLKPDTYQKMTSPQENAVRFHPIFGKTLYGYGITIGNENNYKDESYKEHNYLQIGHTGFAPGFASMNFYYPENNTSVIVLSNLVENSNDIKKSFHYHVEVLNYIKNYVNR